MNHSISPLFDSLRERKRFFFEKKKQKPFVTLGMGVEDANAPGPDSKSLFGFFSSEKELLS